VERENHCGEGTVGIPMLRLCLLLTAFTLGTSALNADKVFAQAPRLSPSDVAAAMQWAESGSAGRPPLV